MSSIVPVILAGGQGTRLWPMSRSARPKQFLVLTGTESSFQQTLRRVSDASRYEAPIIVTNAEYRFLVAEQAPGVGPQPPVPPLRQPLERLAVAQPGGGHQEGVERPGLAPICGHRGLPLSDRP